MNEDVFTALLLSQQLDQKRVVKQKWKRRLLLDAQRDLLNTNVLTCLLPHQIYPISL
jgi:hypothetical protein